MPVKQLADTRVWQRRTTQKQFMVWFGWLIGIAIFSYCWQLISDKTIWAFVSDAPRQAADMASRMVPPKWSYMEKLWAPVWDTINIATLGTVIAIIIAVPVAFLAARNTTPRQPLLPVFPGRKCDAGSKTSWPIHEAPEGEILSIRPGNRVRC